MADKSIVKIGSEDLLLEELAAVRGRLDELTMINDNLEFGILKCRLHRDYPLEYANDKALSMLGYTREQYEKEHGNFAAGLFCEDDLQDVRASLARLLASPKPIRFRVRARRRDGQIALMMGTGVQVADKDGEVCGIFSFKALTELQVFDDDLYKLELLMKNIIGGVVLCEFDKDFTIIYQSEGFCKLCGYSVEEINLLFDNKHNLLIHELDGMWVPDEVTRQLNHSGACSVEYRIKTKAGDVIWVVDKGVLIKNSEGRSILQSVITDITPQKKREEDLLISEKRYAIAMKYSDVTIFDYNIVTGQMTHHWSDIEGFGFSDIMDNGVEELISSGVVHPHSVSAFRQMYEKIQNGEPFASCIIYAEDKDDKAVVLELSLVTIYDSDGKPVRAVGVKKDITETVNLKKEREFGNALASGRSLTFEASLTKDKIVSYDKQWAKSVGLENPNSYSKMTRYVCDNLIAPENAAEIASRLDGESLCREYEEGNRLITFRYRKKQKEGKYRWFEQTVNIVKDESTGEYSIRAYIADINDKKLLEDKGQEEQKFYETMIQRSIRVYEVNLTQNRFVDGHDNWGELFGIRVVDEYDEMIRSFANQAIYPDDKDGFLRIYMRENALKAFANGDTELQCEYRRPGETGEFIWVRCSFHMFADDETGDVKGISYIENIDDEKKKEIELIYRAERDSLTGFYNKAVTEERVDTFLNLPESMGGTHAVIMVDIDYFKSINDNFGHVFGDAVLSQVSARIRELFRDKDVLGRIGGDEFIALMKNIRDKSVAMAKAQEICNNVAETYTQGSKQYRISASVGIAYYDEHGKTYDALYRAADAALYASKDKGRNRFTVYDASIVNGTVTEIKQIDSNNLIEAKTFEKNAGEYVFRICYEASDKREAIKSVLELVGKYFGLSRVFIMELSHNGEYANCNFEWCDENSSAKSNLGCRILREDFDAYTEHFNDDGIFYMPDYNVAEEVLKLKFEPYGVKCTVQIIMMERGQVTGIIGFDNCELSVSNIKTKHAISELRNIANILGMFVDQMRADKEREILSGAVSSIIDSLEIPAYVCDPVTCEMILLNDKMRRQAKGAKEGDVCFEALAGADSPCSGCPMQTLIRSGGEKRSSIITGTYLGERVKVSASMIDWTNGGRACILNCSVLHD